MKPVELPRTPHEGMQLERLEAGDLEGFKRALLESVQLYADTEAGHSGMGSPVLAGVVLAGIARQIDMLAVHVRPPEEPPPDVLALRAEWERLLAPPPSISLSDWSHLVARCIAAREAGPSDDSPNSLQPQLAALRERGGRRVNMPGGQAGPPLPPQEPSPDTTTEFEQRVVDALAIWLCSSRSAITGPPWGAWVEQIANGLAPRVTAAITAAAESLDGTAGAEIDRHWWMQEAALKALRGGPSLPPQEEPRGD